MMTNGSIVRWKNSVQAKAQMKQILTYLAGLSNLKAQSIASLLEWVKHILLWMRRPRFYQFNILDYKERGGEGSVESKDNKLILAHNSEK